MLRTTVLASGLSDTIQENILLIIALGCLLAAMLVTRVVVKFATRMVLLAVIAALLLGAYIERDDLEECADTCSCTIAGFDVEVPNCTPPV